MSKLIIDMPMPTCCARCFLADENDRCSILGTVATQKGRMPNCPIKGVLPETHGRLIDASTVIGIQQDEEDNDVPVTVDDYLGLQFPVPTIVPATERSET